MGYLKASLLICLFLLTNNGLSKAFEEEEDEPESVPTKITHNHEGCQIECDESLCKPPNPNPDEQCLAGVVKDVCGCCYVCALRESQRCHPLPKSTSGPSGCGENMECRLRMDLPSDDSPEALCVCNRQDPICGSDGKTYSNECQLTEARYVRRTEDQLVSRKRRNLADNANENELFPIIEDDPNALRAVARGPCKTAPKIVSPPEDVTNHTGHFVALSCEATGWPVPTIEWMVHRKNSEAIPLPSDDPHVAVQSRGGPSHYEVTSWLQLLKVVDNDEATYWCVATNEVGKDSAAGKVTILPTKNEPHSRKLHRLLTKQ